MFVFMLVCSSTFYVCFYAYFNTLCLFLCSFVSLFFLLFFFRVCVCARDVCVRVSHFVCSIIFCLSFSACLFQYFLSTTLFPLKYYIHKKKLLTVEG